MQLSGLLCDKIKSNPKKVLCLSPKSLSVNIKLLNVNKCNQYLNLLWLFIWINPLSLSYSNLKHIHICLSITICITYVNFRILTGYLIYCPNWNWKQYKKAAKRKRIIVNPTFRVNKLLINDFVICKWLILHNAYPIK